MNNNKLLLAKPIVKELEEIISKKVEQMPLNIHTILVSDDEASMVYLKAKERMCNKLGVGFKAHILDVNKKDEDVLKLIRELNEDKNVHGIMVEMPLAKHLNTTKIVNEIDPNKDMDATTFYNQGRLFFGDYKMIPATPYAVMKIIEHYNIELEGKRVCVVGRSTVVGKPLAILLQEKNATVTVIHSRTKDPEEILRNSDVVVLALGKAKYLKADMVKKDAVVIDVGINFLDGALVGDADFDDLIDKVSFITPVPGGVGPITNRNLLINLLK